MSKRDYELEACQEVESSLPRELGGVRIVRGNAHHEIHGLSDGYCWLDENSRVLLAVEIEKGQNHTDTNVAKYWEWLSAKTSRRLILIHWWYGASKPASGSRIRVTEWIVNSMESALNRRRVRFQYLLVDGKTNLERRDIRRMQDAIAELL